MIEERRAIGSGIWRMSETMRELGDELVDNGGEMTPEIETRLRTVERGAPALVDGIQQLALKVKSEEGALDAEIKRLQALKKSRANAVEGLKRFMLNFMLNTGVERIEGDLCTASVRTSAESVQCDEAAVMSPFASQIEELGRSLPSYLTVEVKVSKTALKEAIRRGEPVKGAMLVRNKTLTLK